MAEPLAELVGTLFDDKATITTLRSHKLGLESLYTILKQGVEIDDHNKLGLTVWENTQIQSVVSVAYAIVSLIRSVTVEQVEPIVVAVMEKSLEFVICCLESLVGGCDDLTFIQLLEIALVDGTIKEADVSHPSSVNLLIDSLKSISIKSDNVDLQEHVECIIRGNSCSKEQKPVDRLLMTLASEWTQNDNMNSWTIGRSSHDFNKLVPLLQHWAVVHLGCIQRLVSYCTRLVEGLDKCDEKIDGINLRKRMSFCTRIFKLLASVTKDTPYVEYGAELMGSFACFTNVLPSLFRSGYEFATSNLSAEFSIENLVLLLLEAFLHLVHTIFCNSNVFQNILACVIVSVVENLDVDVWKYDKSITNIKLPVAYFPRIVLYTLKLVDDIKKQHYQALELRGLHAADSGNSTDVEVDSFSFGVGSGRIYFGDRKYVHAHEVCYEVLHNLILFNALSEPLEDYLVRKILTIENGSFVYNQQTLSLLAHTLICQVDLSGNQLRMKVHKVFVEFVSEKVKSVCARCPVSKNLLRLFPQSSISRFF